MIPYEVPNYKKEKDPHGFHDNWIQENFGVSIKVVYLNHSDIQESIAPESQVNETLHMWIKTEDNTFLECKLILTSKLENYRLDCKLT